MLTEPRNEKRARIGICTAGVSPSPNSPTLNSALQYTVYCLQYTGFIWKDKRLWIVLSWKHVCITHCIAYGSHSYFIANKSSFNGLHTDTQQFRLLLSVGNFVTRTFPLNFLKLVSKYYLASNFIVLTSTEQGKSFFSLSVCCSQLLNISKW